VTTDHGRAIAPVPDPESDIPAEPPRRRLRRRLLWTTLGVTTVAATGVGAWFWTRDGSADATPSAAAPAATAVVERATLAATETWDGTLGHGTPVAVSAGGAGTITGLVEQGAAVERGTALYRLDEQPVTLLYGAVPMYRDLGVGADGADVEQLEANLVALGYDGFIADDEYTDRTADAVMEWQEDIGADETGGVTRSAVVFLEAGGQVDTVQAAIGDSVTPGSAVLDVTGTEQVVSLEVEVDDRDLVAVGTAVTVVLPGGQEVPGTVASATVTEAESDDSGPTAPDEGAGGGDSVTEVEVTLTKAAPADLDGSTVDVVVAVDERTDVLTVPVNALLALAEGGYGLEVVADDGTSSIVAVETGLFANGQVEVTGEIAEGTTVGVAGR
jgi:Putative peptidoglycan binding domain